MNDPGPYSIDDFMLETEETIKKADKEDDDD